MTTTVDAGELEDAVLTVSEAGTTAQAWVCRDTGQVHVRPGLAADEPAPVPADVGEADKYVPVPTVRTLKLGLGMLFDFVAAAMPDEEERVRQMFKQPGAYGDFSDLLDERDLQDRWHAFREAQTQAVLGEWCEEHGLQLAG